MSPAKRALTLALGSAAVLGVQTAIAKIMDWSMEGGGGVVPMAFGIASQVGKGKAAYSPISREEIAAAFPQVAQALIGLSRLALWGSGNALAYPRQDSFYDHNTNVDCGDMRVVERPFPNIPLGLAIHISWQIPSTEVADMALKYMQRLNYKMLSAVEAAVRLPGTEPEVS
ncbi:MAG TPA: hypothetical protein DF383_04175, partial [Deltaproteobacteria bacterium]|nr:hypothetical protein [Deltaproteobacteria bacterium]